MVLTEQAECQARAGARPRAPEPIIERFAVIRRLFPVVLTPEVACRGAMIAAIRARDVPIWAEAGLPRRGEARLSIGASKGPKAKVDWADLIGRVAAHGDRAAFKRLFEHFAPRIKGLMQRAGCSSDEAEEIATGRRDKVTSGREKMEREIVRVAGAGLAEQYGMEVSDVHVKRVNYVESVRRTVYDRMRSERTRIARRYESEAEEEKNRILGQMRFELDQIEGEMEQESAKIRGEADAQVIKMTAEAYGQSPEFYEFLRRLEVFKATFGPETRLILSTDSEVFRLFEDAGIEQ